MKRNVLLFAAVLSFGSMAAMAADSAKLSGWISDEMCGAKHAGSGAACAKKCIEGGEKPVFVDSAKKSVWKIDNPDAVKGHYGEKVTITATTNDSDKSVHIDSVEAAK